MAEVKEEIEKLIADIGHRRLKIYPHREVDLNKLMEELKPSVRKAITIKFEDFRNKYNWALYKIRIINGKVLCDKEIKGILGKESKQFFQDIDLLYVDLVFSNPYVIEYYNFLREKRMNRIILVTGGNSGIGKGIVQSQIDIGNNVICTYNKTENVSFKIEKKDQFVKQLKVDITVDDEVKELFQMIKTDFGRLDGLVNNAGLAYGNLTSLSPIEEIGRYLKLISLRIYVLFKRPYEYSEKGIMRR